MLWDVVETQCHCPSVATVWNADKARSPVVFYSGTTDGDILAVVDVQNCFLKEAGWERRLKCFRTTKREGGRDDEERKLIHVREFYIYILAVKWLSAALYGFPC